MKCIYNKLFPTDSDIVFNNDDIRDSINAIIKNGVVKCNEDTISSSIEAGHTYLGQMIAHDIVPSRRFNRGSASHYLNLDSLYGDSNNVAYFDKSGRFILGAIHVKDRIIADSDLFRNMDGSALIPDIRNDENIIVSQLHLFWQKFHNTIVDYLQDLLGKGNNLILARYLVTSIFHEIIKYDYLEQILDEDVHELYIKSAKHFSLFYNEEYQYNAVPHEFSHAVFRFGHSMVRKNYTLNSIGGISSENMLSDRKLLLTEDNIIKWNTFFTMSDYLNSSYHNKNINKNRNKNLEEMKNKGDEFLVQDANKIDSNIELSLKEVPVKGKYFDIRELNLKAGFSKHILNGKEISKCLIENNSHKLSEQIQKKLKEGYEQISEMPLWPYILHEAEKIKSKKGLGVVASIIVAEVLSSSMNYKNINKDINLLHLIIIDIKKNQKKTEYLRLKLNFSNELYIKKEFSKIVHMIDKNPIKMGYLINYVNRGKI